MRLARLGAALALAGCAHAPQPSPPMDAAASLAAAETAFAAHSVREDMRAAFLAHFADDGVFVRDGWTVSNDYLSAQPAPPIVLDWRPVFAEVAASGELGLSTGPVKITSKTDPNEPPAFGQYVSVWRRAGQGPWRVAVDLGIGHREPALRDAPLVTRMSPGVAARSHDGIEAAELDFVADAHATSFRAAYGKHGAESLRFYREGEPPAVGKASALASRAMPDAKLAWIIDRTEIARSGDFGYARGSFASAAARDKPLGYYLRVWHVEDGHWRIVMDVANPAR